MGILNKLFKRKTTEIEEFEMEFQKKYKELEKKGELNKIVVPIINYNKRHIEPNCVFDKRFLERVVVMVKQSEDLSIDCVKKLVDKGTGLYGEFGEEIIRQADPVEVSIDSFHLALKSLYEDLNIPYTERQLRIASILAAASFYQLAYGDPQLALYEYGGSKNDKVIRATLE